MGDAPFMSEGTYGIKGLPRPPNAVRQPGEIPYVPNLPVRKEISSLADSDDPDERKQWTLFVLALERFKLMPVDQKLSYFQIAGIHGYPEVAWDGAPEPKHAPNAKTKKPGDQPFGGYCNHNSVNFPAWHRPYMLLFEQRIWENMKLIIQVWVDKYGLSAAEAEEWYAVAKSWRMPYWDWARHQQYSEDLVCPLILTQGPVRIYPPAAVGDYYPPSGLYANPFWNFENPEKDEKTGKPLKFGSMSDNKAKWNIKDNPIVHEEFPLQEGCDWAPWSKTSGTSRYGIFKLKNVNSAEKDPTTHFTGLQGVNNSWQANNRLANVQQVGRTGKPLWSTMDKYSKDYTWNPGTLTDAVNRMYCKGYNSTWGQFASTKWIAEGNGCPETGYISLEYIHNNIHNLAGGSDYATGMGHMSDVPVAAFDPIFWLHHVQIDRLLAIWQCLYPELWFDEEWSDEPDSTDTKGAHVADDKETDPLEPFHRKDNDPDKEVWTAKECRDWTELNYQYDDLAELANKNLLKHGRFIEEEYKKELRAHVNSLYPGTGHLIQEMKERNEMPDGLGPSNGKTGEWNDYIINVVYDRYGLDGLSYTIEFYLGGPSGENTTHFDRHNYVGHVYSFGGNLSTIEGSCSNCKRQAEVEALSCGQVPLTIPLLHHARDSIPDHSIRDFTEIEEYLKLHLRWRVIKYGGEVVSEEAFKKNFTKTKISVLRGVGRVSPVNLGSRDSSEGQHLINGIAQRSDVVLSSVYNNYVFLPDVTNGKPGGLQSSGTRNNVPDVSTKHELKRRLPIRRFTTNDVCVLDHLSCPNQIGGDGGGIKWLSGGINCSNTLLKSTKVR